ncbi:hypothetical protein EYB25_003822 [Talaromyces marneffei]|uniref:uncharacterized protein n=1 Tax=Talaromyces marneffei TaxID=37727 RepID=UPI0012AA7B4A|nr:uncharacterized protein EYB26_006299 [Talaromyces marneffei]KAE8555274.1 hypothetical protein EYB25_003822 [Talaromyces marneffei]QGA18614.1 hypothetical protein EYB26_006299 [Talaromyces marneffei]
MKYTTLTLAAFVSMAAAIRVGKMDRTLGNMNDAAIKRENLPIADPMRNEELPIAGDESRIGDIMKIPITTVDKSKIYQRDEHFKED